MPPATPSQTAGPFFAIGLSDRPRADELVAAGSEGSLELVGSVLDGAGNAIPDALVEIWQADATGTFRDDFGWGRSATTDAGEYRFLTLKPGAATTSDGRLQAPHLSVLVFARGLLKPVYTRMYFPDEETANAEDALLAALSAADREALVAVAEGAGRLRFDIRLQGERQTPFLVP